jgi:hypothetical protein
MEPVDLTINRLDHVFTNDGATNVYSNIIGVEVLFSCFYTTKKHGVFRMLEEYTYPNSIPSTTCWLIV